MVWGLIEMFLVVWAAGFGCAILFQLYWGSGEALLGILRALVK